MAEKKTVALAVICMILASGLIGAVVLLKNAETEIEAKTEHISEIENENSVLETQVLNLQTETSSLSCQVSGLESEVSSLQAETSILENQNSELENDKVVLESQVSALQLEKIGLETQVSVKESEIAALNSNLSSLEGQVSSLQNDVLTLENEVVQSYNSGYVEGESDGYQDGYDDGYSQGVEFLTENGVYLRDPTYAEALAFINADQTDLNPYISPTYVCYDFTADLIANTIQAGYRCGFVYIEFASSAHAIACFNTTDQGMIYVEPQNDNLVTITIGQPYLGYNVVDMGIIW